METSGPNTPAPQPQPPHAEDHDENQQSQARGGTVRVVPDLSGQGKREPCRHQQHWPGFAGSPKQRQGEQRDAEEWAEVETPAGGNLLE